MSNKILIVEDDKTLLDVLAYNLKKEGYSTVTASGGNQALELAGIENPDLIILDIMLPELDGLEVCRILRKEMTVPILMLTAKTGEVDRVVGLELGADDYLPKPFSLRELLARVRALLRRVEMVRNEVSRDKTTVAETIKIADLEINLKGHRVTRNGEDLDFSPKEFDLLAFLAANRGQVFSRDYLLDKVWGYDYPGETRTVDVHIRWLRRKIENNPSRPLRLLTVRGVGYKIEA
jgi:two-component system, OmpR family, response regulator